MLCCSISEDVMRDPVLLIETGQTYDRANIEAWFARGNSTCPLTGKVVESKALVPNFALKGMVLEWAERTGYDLSPPALPVRFPPINPADFPPGPPTLTRDSNPLPRHQWRRTQRLRHKRSCSGCALPSTQMEAYLRGLSYDVHVLHELASDSACRAHLCEEGAASALVPLLSASQVPELQARVLMLLTRLAAGNPSVAQQIASAGGAVPLGGLVASREGAVREAAAALLYAAGPHSPQLRMGLAADASAAVPSLEPLFQGLLNGAVQDASLLRQAEAGAWALSALLPATPLGPLPPSAGNVVRGLAIVLAGPSASARWAAGQALTHLLHGNQRLVVQEVVGASAMAGMEALDELCRLFWTWAMSGNATNLQMVALYQSTAGFLHFLGRALQGGSCLALGLLQCLAYEDVRRPATLTISFMKSQSVKRKWEVLTRVSHFHRLGRSRVLHQRASDRANEFGSKFGCPEAGSGGEPVRAVPSCTSLILLQGGNLLALHALTNLAAYRSGACPACASQMPRFRLQLGLNSDSAQSTCPHSPAVVISEQPNCVHSLLCLLSSPNMTIAAAAVQALNNLTAYEPSFERLRSTAKEQGSQDIRARLNGLLAAPAVSPRGKDAARSLLQRLEAKRGAVPVNFTFSLLLLPPPAPQAQLPPFL
eukprot:jgi/Botrbrau1/13882/Bobra.0056s0113.1